MTNQDKAEAIAKLPSDQQVDLMQAAARATEPRPVRGNTNTRFYAHECGLSRRVVAAMRSEGHGEKIYSGKGSNSGRWYFPIEILERAATAARSSHARIKLYASCGQK
ncbi:hypothetical protein [Sagittula sp. S175]|uniref:hypothetical protein n=1 Tax=Sagittula sp. S175 TaxID=3415129 RepID=UPI003C7DA3FD